MAAAHFTTKMLPINILPLIVSTDFSFGLDLSATAVFWPFVLVPVDVSFCFYLSITGVLGLSATGVVRPFAFVSVDLSFGVDLSITGVFTVLGLQTSLQLHGLYKNENYIRLIASSQMYNVSHNR